MLKLAEDVACESEAGQPCACHQKVSFWKIDELCYTEGGQVDMKDQDSYGSAVREAMKKSMEQPAGWKHLNHREPRTVDPLILGLTILGIVLGGISLVYLFDGVESLFR